MHEFFAISALLISAYICLRLLTYRRPPDARHRPLVAWFAWGLIAATGSYALTILLRGPSAMFICPWSVFCLAVLALLVWRAHGNVAHLLGGI